MSQKRRITVLTVLAAAMLGSFLAFKYAVAPRMAAANYAEAVRFYNIGRQEIAFDLLQNALWYSPRDAGINTLMGWYYWGRGSVDAAESCFLRAVESEPASVDAKYGLALTRMASGQPADALTLLEEVTRSRPGDPGILLKLAETQILTGNNQRAAATYRELIQQDPGNAEAQDGFLALLGYQEFAPGLPYTIQEKPRPSENQLHFRTQGDYIQVRENDNWRTIYITGVNLGPARPGESATTASKAFETYRVWLDQIHAMNANAVRIYTILPPAFYQAFADFNRNSKSPLWLVQEVWLDDAVTDLFDPEATAAFDQEITRAIDVLHGQADIPCGPGRYCGIYTADISRYVLSLALGREIEPSLALRSNSTGKKTTSFEGRYVSLESGNPSEAWFARACDRAAEYESERYNAQRPLSLVNWPPLDPIFHPTESSQAEEEEFLKKQGQGTTSRTLPEFPDDLDVVSLDLTRFRAGSDFKAGLFVVYHVYQHWPDFLFLDSELFETRDAFGSNPYFGYLRKLKQHYHSIPLLIGEYGASTSIAPTHLHPFGWHAGGLSESRQDELLTRFSRNIFEAGCAGGIVFQWHDEWWKSTPDSNIRDFELPRDRDSLWHNRLDPEENFGLAKFETARAQRAPQGAFAAWDGAVSLYRRPDTESPPPGHLREVLATHDHAHLYLRVAVEGNGSNRGKWSYWLALSTLDGRSGTRILPGIDVRIPSGVNFLLQIEPEAARLLVAENYSPTLLHTTPELGEHRSRKRNMELLIEEESPFVEMVNRVNRLRFGRDGTMYPALDFSRSLLFPEPGESGPTEDSRALWRWNPGQGTLELRLPWGLLMITDPSTRRAFAGTDGEGNPISVETSGIEISVFALRRVAPTKDSGAILLDSFPHLSGQAQFGETPAKFVWQPWDRDDYVITFKPAYFSLSKVFRELQAKVP